MADEPRTPGKKKAVKHKRTARDPSQRVKSAKGRKNSSTAWLKRQLNDPYVREAERLGYRSRAAFKLLELNEKLNFLRSDTLVIDLGSAPGGWTQVAQQKGAQVIALDLLPMDPVPETTFIQMDFSDDDAPDKLLAAMNGRQADAVLSDIAPNTTGHKATDHLRIIALAEMACDFAAQVLAPGGTFVCKVFQGGAQDSLLKQLKADFKTVKHIKPPASRKDSSELYVVGLGFK